MFSLFADAVLIGIIEGVTEFLPVSSTGHIILASHLLNFQGTPGRSFELGIQTGAVLALVWLYRRALAGVACALMGAKRADFNWARLTAPERDPRDEPHGRDRIVPGEIPVYITLGYGGRGPVWVPPLLALRFLLNLTAAFLPAAVLGLLLHHFITEHLFTILNVSCMLILGGFGILAVEKWKPRPRMADIDHLGLRHAFLLGLFQALALIPGVSRSGATIMGGMMLGLDRRASVEFSFLLAIPTLLAAGAYDLLGSWSLLSAEDWKLLGTGFIAAFVTAMIVVRPALAFISRFGFAPFAYYRIILGLGMLAFMR